MFVPIKPATKETGQLKHVSHRKSCPWLSTALFIIYLVLLVCFSMGLLNVKILVKVQLCVSFHCPP